MTPEFARARDRRLLIQPPTFAPSPVGSPAFVGRVVTATPVVGKFVTVNPVAITGTESEGSSGVLTVGSAVVPVLLLGPGAPSTGEDMLCRFVSDRWVASRKTPTSTVNVRIHCYCFYTSCPVAGALVTLKNGAGTTLGTATSDASGNAGFSGVAAGPISASATKTSWQTVPTAGSSYTFSGTPTTFNLNIVPNALNAAYSTGHTVTANYVGGSSSSYQACDVTPETVLKTSQPSDPDGCIHEYLGTQSGNVRTSVTLRLGGVTLAGKWYTAGNYSCVQGTDAGGTFHYGYCDSSCAGATMCDETAQTLDNNEVTTECFPLTTPISANAAVANGYPAPPPSSVTWSLP